MKVLNFTVEIVELGHDWDDYRKVCMIKLEDVTVFTHTPFPNHMTDEEAEKRRIVRLQTVSHKF